MQCTAITGNGRSQIDADVAIEKSFDLIVNRAHIATFLASPQELDALATGFLLCEGLARSADEITSINVRDGTIVCKLNLQSYGRTEEIHPISSTVCFEQKIIFDAIDEFKKRGQLWRRTGGTHSSIISSPAGDVLAFSEDVSRACSVDKAVGKAVLSGIDPADCMLATTGRLSVTIVAKAARAGFPLIASKAAPMSEGVRLAERSGITLVAFARRPNLYVYAWEQRVASSLSGWGHSEPLKRPKRIQ